MSNNPTISDVLAKLRADLTEAGFDEIQAYDLARELLPDIVAGRVSIGDASPSNRVAHEERVAEQIARLDKAAEDEHRRAVKALPKQIAETSSAIAEMRRTLDALEQRIADGVRRGSALRGYCIQRLAFVRGIALHCAD